MINLFKKKEEELREVFLIGNYDFSFDKENSTIEIENNQIIDLTIKSSEPVFEELCESDEFEFGYGLYPPEFNAHEIDLGRKKQIRINEKNLYDYEIALYFMEHNDVKINLSLTEDWILIMGFTSISGKEYPLEIKLKR
ncbi:hypothetical protein DS884_10810 [Tenacibaculum sp. E3R01]|uniref:hypothetical protein n=1 Tax=Tenacibaculum sp. E3R01 TaxID=2267227 RepID=UPI000DE9A2B5|nr:hypothetical protein [Tenacibaculum sp. E3R01]RBW57538.1 hypothetical protein DS884_10810 [Tenacibaculum sp. E3R01]